MSGLLRSRTSTSRSSRRATSRSPTPSSAVPEAARGGRGDQASPIHGGPGLAITRAGGWGAGAPGKESSRQRQNRDRHPQMTATAHPLPQAKKPDSRAQLLWRTFDTGGVDE